MTWFKVTLSASQPISIGRTNAKSFLTHTSPLITGAALRGALAVQWLRSRTPDATFQRLFDGEVRFGPLLRDDCQLESLSVTQCKYHHGDRHPRYFDRAFETGEQTVCRGVPDPLKGRIRSTSGGPAALSITTSTAIDHRTGVALDGSLFSRQSNPKGSTFTGYIVGDKELVDLLGACPRLTLGGRSSVQGAAQLRIDEADAPEITGRSSVIRALSPIILADDAARPSTDLGAALRRHKLTPDGIFAGRVTTVGTGGWHAASGLPKPTDLALEAGTVAVVQGTESAVADLLDHGLGLRRAEGFGFLELVTEPWSVLQLEDDEPGVPWQASDGWRRQLRECALNPAQARWLAVQVTEVPNGAHAEVHMRLSRPGAATLSQSQRTTIERLLLDCPQQDRAALARDLRTGRV